MVVLDEMKKNSISKKPTSAMSVMLCTGATFPKKNSFLVARIVSFNTVALDLLTFPILEPYPSKDIALNPSHVIQMNGIYIVHFKSYLNHCFSVSQLLKYVMYGQICFLNTMLWKRFFKTFV